MAAVTAVETVVSGPMPGQSMGQRKYQLGRFLFRSDFDSGNLGGVTLADGALDGQITSPPPHFDLSIASDAMGTKHENKYRMWYFFSMQGGYRGETVHLRITDMNSVAKVYNQDLRPLVRVASRSEHWERLAEHSEYIVTNQVLELSFQYTFVCGPEDRVFFAFYYPFPLKDNQRMIAELQASHGGISNKTRVPSHVPRRAIYFHREVLTVSPENRPVELITISSCEGIMNEREPSIDGLFPGRTPRSHRFRGKTGVFLSARVHPAETASSYMLFGFIHFLLKSDDPRAQLLRQRYVFKVVPIINPDGVARGHFRGDLYAVNLNRTYLTPHPLRQPSVFAIKLVLKQMSDYLESPPEDKKGTNGVWAYFDLHGYTARTGCYLLGNSLPPHREAHSMTLAHLLGITAPQFSTSACSYGRSKRSLKQRRARRETRREAKAAYEASLRTPEPPDVDGAEGAEGEGDRVDKPQTSGTTTKVIIMPVGASASGGPAEALLSEGEGSRLLKDWSAFKARSIGKQEGQKDGTGRCAVYREVGVPHSYTIECSCNLRPHRCTLAPEGAVYVSQRDPDGPMPTRQAVSLDAIKAAEAAVTRMMVVMPIGAGAGAGAGSAPREIVHGSSMTVPPRAADEARPATPEVMGGYLCHAPALQPPVAGSEYTYATSPGASGPPLLAPLPGTNRVCEWGTCPFYPPAAFASIGRGTALSLLELAGIPAQAGLPSVLSDTQFGDLAGLDRHCRKLAGAMVPYEPTRGRSFRSTSGASSVAGSAGGGSGPGSRRSSRTDMSSGLGGGDSAGSRGGRGSGRASAASSAAPSRRSSGRSLGSERDTSASGRGKARSRPNSGRGTVAGSKRSGAGGSSQAVPSSKSGGSRGRGSSTRGAGSRKGSGTSSASSRSKQGTGAGSSRRAKASAAATAKANAAAAATGPAPVSMVVVAAPDDTAGATSGSSAPTGATTGGGRATVVMRATRKTTVQMVTEQQARPRTKNGTGTGGVGFYATTTVTTAAATTVAMAGGGRQGSMLSPRSRTSSLGGTSLNGGGGVAMDEDARRRAGHRRLLSSSLGRQQVTTVGPSIITVEPRMITRHRTKPVRPSSFARGKGGDGAGSGSQGRRHHASVQSPRTGLHDDGARRRNKRHRRASSASDGGGGGGGGSGGARGAGSYRAATQVGAQFSSSRGPTGGNAAAGAAGAGGASGSGGGAGGAAWATGTTTTRALDRALERHAAMSGSFSVPASPVALARGEKRFIFDSPGGGDGMAVSLGTASGGIAAATATSPSSAARRRDLEYRQASLRMRAMSGASGGEEGSSTAPSPIPLGMTTTPGSKGSRGSRGSKGSGPGSGGSRAAKPRGDAIDRVIEKVDPNSFYRAFFRSSRDTSPGSKGNKASSSGGGASETRSPTRGGGGGMRTSGRARLDASGASGASGGGDSDMDALDSALFARSQSPLVPGSAHSRARARGGASSVSPPGHNLVRSGRPSPVGPGVSGRGGRTVVSPDPIDLNAAKLAATPPPIAPAVAPKPVRPGATPSRAVGVVSGSAVGGSGARGGGGKDRRPPTIIGYDPHSPFTHPGHSSPRVAHTPAGAAGDGSTARESPRRHHRRHHNKHRHHRESSPRRGESGGDKHRHPRRSSGSTSDATPDRHHRHHHGHRRHRHAGSTSASGSSSRSGGRHGPSSGSGGTTQLSVQRRRNVSRLAAVGSSPLATRPRPNTNEEMPVTSRTRSSAPPRRRNDGDGRANGHTHANSSGRWRATMTPVATSASHAAAGRGRSMTGVVASGRALSTSPTTVGGADVPGRASTRAAAGATSGGRRTDTTSAPATARRKARSQSGGASSQTHATAGAGEETVAPTPPASASGGGAAGKKRRGSKKKKKRKGSRRKASTKEGAGAGTSGKSSGSSSSKMKRKARVYPAPPE